MAFDKKLFRVERLLTEVGYHAAYRFWDLKGVLAERWAHGPTFGAYGDDGTESVRLLPPLEAEDRRVIAVYGLKSAAVLGEGVDWASQARALSSNWLSDVYEAYAPKRTIRIRHQVIALYPLKDAARASRKLRTRFYVADELSKMVPDRFGDDFHAAVEGIAFSASPPLSWVVGAIGPPHQRAGFFTFPDEVRDAQWWMGIRLDYIIDQPEGIPDPIVLVSDVMDRSNEDMGLIARTVLPSVVD